MCCSLVPSCFYLYWIPYITTWIFIIMHKKIRPHLHQLCHMTMKFGNKFIIHRIKNRLVKLFKQEHQSKQYQSEQYQDYLYKQYIEPGYEYIYTCTCSISCFYSNKSSDFISNCIIPYNRTLNDANNIVLCHWEIDSWFVTIV